MISVETEISDLFGRVNDRGWDVGGPFRSLLEMERPLDQLMTLEVMVLTGFVGYRGGIVPLYDNGYSQFADLLEAQPTDLMIIPKIGIKRAHTICAGRDLLIKACAIFQEINQGRKFYVGNTLDLIN